jgi:hypothetical protein
LDAKKIVSWVGTGLMLVSLWFITRRLAMYGVDFSLLTSPIVVLGLFAVAAAEGVAMFGAAFNFRELLKNTSGALVDKPLAAVVYLTANLYKYIPGGIMMIAGRHKMVMETRGLSHKKLVFSTVLEGVLYIVGALVVIGVFAFSYLSGYFSRMERLPLFVLVAGGLFVVFAAVSAAKIFLKDTEILKPAVFAKHFGFAVGLMFLWGFTFLLTLVLLGQPMNSGLAANIIGLYLLAWVVGFAAPGAPSGFGVREALMLVFLDGMVYTEILIAAMVLHRVITVGGDLIGYAIAVMYQKYAEEQVLQNA